MSQPSTITRIKALLNDALMKAEEFRDAIAAEIDDAGEAAAEEMHDNLATAEDILANIQSAVDSVDDAFPVESRLGASAA